MRGTRQCSAPAGEAPAALHHTSDKAPAEQPCKMPSSGWGLLHCLCRALQPQKPWLQSGYAGHYGHAAFLQMGALAEASLHTKAEAAQHILILSETSYVGHKASSALLQVRSCPCSLTALHGLSV